MHHPLVSFCITASCTRRQTRVGWETNGWQRTRQGQQQNHLHSSLLASPRSHRHLLTRSSPPRALCVRFTGNNSESWGERHGGGWWCSSRWNNESETSAGRSDELTPGEDEMLLRAARTPSVRRRKAQIYLFFLSFKSHIIVLPNNHGPVTAPTVLRGSKIRFGICNSVC